MDTSIHKCLAVALLRNLASLINTGRRRRFFRLDDFDDETYRELLHIFRNQQNTITTQKHPILARTIAPIAGYEEYALEEERSATWHRNHVPAGHALILIFNQPTSDAQSLTSIYPITESRLATEGLEHLVVATFVTYKLSAAQLKTLERFLTRLRTKLFQPQLRDLVGFLRALHTFLHTNPGDSLERAIAEALPYLGLFRCNELADKLNTPKGDRLLQHVLQASRLGRELLDQTRLNGYLQRLQDATLEDDTPHGLSAAEKRARLERFLTRVMMNQDDLRQVFELDWNEVAPILHKQVRTSRADQLKDLANTVRETIATPHPGGEPLPESVEGALRDMAAGREPEEAGLDSLLDDYGDGLPKATRNKLHRMRRTTSYQSADFIAGLTNLITRMLTPLRADLPAGTTVRVQIDPQSLDTEKSSADTTSEAVLAFRTLFGGIEQQMPAIQWTLEPLWAAAQQYAHADLNLDDDPGEREKIKAVSLMFNVSVVAPDDQVQERGVLTWQYRADNTIAATYAHIQSEAQQAAATPGSLRIPIYTTIPDSSDSSDLDLSRPLHNLGVWYRAATDMGQALREMLQQRGRPATRQAIEPAITGLEQAWARFVQQANQHGVLTANLDDLLQAYEALLNAATTHLTSGQEASYGFRVLTQAWMIGPTTFDEWAVMPALHPLKLHWWRERTRTFNGFIARLLDATTETQVVNMRRFCQELTVTYSSAGHPAVLALPGRDGRCSYFLPVHEVDGYELFRHAEQAGIAYGLDPDLVSSDESESTAEIAATELARVIQDYLETYPYVHDGLEVYLVECRNGSLPGQLITRLQRLVANENRLRLSLTVHTTERGTSLYERATTWLAAHEALAERPPEEYFPLVNLRVVQCSYPDLFQQIGGTSDIAILPDVLAKQGQQVEAEIQPASDPMPLAGYLPTNRMQQAPFERDELSRDMLLLPQAQPALLQAFYAIQWAAAERKSVPRDQAISFKLRVSLQDWEHELHELHRRCNWVACYDTTVDRFLLEATFPESVEVIRYSLGLGVKRRHNLTVSSSYRAQDVVLRRLTRNLANLLPGTPTAFREQVAESLINEAKRVSGDIVLRAAGPGAYLNELIGMVVAQHLTEQRYLHAHPGALTAWIYLDDFSHWFDSGKFPDLLFVAIPPEANGTLPLHIEVLETKCVGESNIAVEATDAQRQVKRGVNRLAQAWAPGSTHLDAPYWYDQLYRAVVGNLEVQPEQMRLWEALRQCLITGDFLLEMSGHAWVFCYDGPAGLRGPHEEGDAAITATDVGNIPHRYQHFGRVGLRRALRSLVEETWHLAVPPDTWAPQHDTSAPIPTLDFPDTAAEPAALPAPGASEQTNATPVVSQPPAATPPAEPDPEPVHAQLREQARNLDRVLRQYNLQTYSVDVTVADIGPSVVRFKIRLRPGEQLSKLQRVAPDLARELALTSVPLIDNVPATNYVGIDLPRPQAETVPLLPLLETLPTPAPGELPIIIGRTPDGQTIIEDMSEFPHALVAGATNSGKSVFLRSVLLCLMARYGPADIRFLIIDPKRTDFSFFNGLPHVISGNAITDPAEARDRLLELVRTEMPRRQDILAGRSLKVKDFNQRYPAEALPPIVAMIDEYAQLISIMSKRERDAFERDLMSLAAVARSTGIHLILATQRPSADVVTGTLTANLDARIAFKVASAVNSRIVIDQNGAENLLGRGDLLFRRPSGEILRAQAPFVDEVEIQAYVKRFRW